MGRTESDAVAKALESFDEAASDLLTVVFIEVVGAEVEILAIMLEEMPDDGQDGVNYRDRCLFGTRLAARRRN